MEFCQVVAQTLLSFFFFPGVFGVVYDGYLSNAEDEPEGTTPVIVKTVKGEQ